MGILHVNSSFKRQNDMHETQLIASNLSLNGSC